MLRLYRTIVAVFIGLIISAGLFWYYSYSASPMLANYYLGTLPTDSDSINKLAKNDLLILSPEQYLVRRSVIEEIKRKNPKIILLAYVPSQSYNNSWQNHPANVLYSNFNVQNDWWLRDSRGNVISNWPGLKNTNLSRGWSDYMIEFVKNNILSQGVWDGIFWDMVNDGISTVNGGDIDLNGDGQRDDASFLNEEWRNRTVYLLSRSQSEFNVKYILINGSSIGAYQKYVNGRMYEDYPTPWEPGGWSGVMNGLERNRPANRAPKMYVFNANTNNTGKKDDYRKVRFSLVSSLLLDNVYFSFDHGSQDHSQVWWYDEYDVKLGEPVGSALSLSGKQSYGEDVWRREYTHGLAIVNVTWQSQDVDLGGEYEKIIGKQDPAVNDGAIVSRVQLGARDGLVLLKTFQTIQNVVFVNGGFVRFFDSKGGRSRNGFFAFEEGVPGGAKVFNGDLDGVSGDEKIVASGRKMDIINSAGEKWYSDYLFNSGFKGKLNFAVGRLLGQSEKQILVSGSTGNQVMLLDYHGVIIKAAFYPLDKKFTGGFSVAVGNVDGGATGEAMLGVGRGRAAEVIIYDSSLKKIKKRFFPYDKKFIGGVKVAAGDVNNDGKDEIITVAVVNRKAVVRVFNSAGKRLSSFNAASAFGNSEFSVSAADVNFDGVDEIVVASGG